jgi:uncharacterized protein
MPAPIPVITPEINPETKPFWDATTQGKFLLKRCLDCQSIIWYPRAFCPECYSTNVEWFEASGKGTVYTFCINYRGEGPWREASPFVLSYVELEEGPRVMTNIVDVDPHEVAVGMPVEVVFADTGKGAAVYRFKPAS